MTVGQEGNARLGVQGQGLQVVEDDGQAQDREVDLADDGSAGRVTRLLRSDAFAFPTAVAVSGGRLLVVNGQLDQMGGQPRLPFTVAVVAIPETW
ncbi:MAG: hypothetical protein ACTHPS_14850 [Streptosporangiaceae bacterium]